jgi:ribosomal protein S27AE
MSFKKPKSFLDKRRCPNCGGTTFVNKYADYLDGSVLLEAQTDCANCKKPVYVFLYGYNEDYTFTLRQLIRNLRFP